SHFDATTGLARISNHRGTEDTEKCKCFVFLCVLCASVVRNPGGVNNLSSSYRGSVARGIGGVVVGRESCVNSSNPMPSGRNASSGASAGSENACTPLPGTTRRTLNAHVWPCETESPVSMINGIAASTTHSLSSSLTLTNQRGSQVL